MKIIKEAVAGTLESSDLMVTVKPGDTLEIEIESIVLNQFGDDIRQCIMDVVEEYGIAGGTFHINDRGALDCTIRARIETVIERGGGQ